MVPKAQKEPSWIGGPTKGLGPRTTLTWGQLELQKELKYWLSWPQHITALTPSVKQPWFVHVYAF